MPTMPERLTEGEAQVEAIRARVTEAKRDPICPCGVCRDREVLLAARDAERATRAELEAARQRLQAALDEATRARDEARSAHDQVLMEAATAERGRAAEHQRADEATRARDEAEGRYHDATLGISGKEILDPWIAAGGVRSDPSLGHLQARITIRLQAAEARAEQAERALADSTRANRERHRAWQHDVKARADAEAQQREQEAITLRYVERLHAAEADAARLRGALEEIARTVTEEPIGNYDCCTHVDDAHQHGWERGMWRAGQIARAALAAPAGGLLDAVRAALGALQGEIAKGRDEHERTHFRKDRPMAECDYCLCQHLTALEAARARLAAALGEGTEPDEGAAG